MTNKITWMQPYYDIILGMIPLGIKNLVDVGAGSGIFGFILKVTRPDVYTIAVEPFNYDLKHYNSHSKLTWKDFDEQFSKHIYYNVIVSNECIEHMEKSDALQFLKDAKNLADKVIIATPYKFEQQEAYDGNDYQIHRCIITQEDFEKLGYKVTYIGTLSKRYIVSRVSFHPRLKNFMKLIGCKPTNIIGVFSK